MCSCVAVASPPDKAGVSTPREDVALQYPTPAVGAKNGQLSSEFLTQDEPLYGVFLPLVNTNYFCIRATATVYFFMQMTLR